MKSANLFPLGLLTLALATTFLFSCKKETNPVTAFLNCNDNCTEAALEVKDAYLKDPQPVLFAFAWKGNEENEAKFVQWLGILRDSFFFNQEGTGLTGMQLAEIKAQMLASAETFINDSNLAPVANRFIAEIGPLVIVGQVDVPGNAYTGTFAYELPNEAGSGELKLAPAGDSSVRFSLLVVAGPPAYNQGTMDGATTIRPDGALEIKTSEYGSTCRLEITFAAGNAIIKTLEGDSPACGFGNNVMADGTYKMVSPDDPFAAVAIDPAMLEGGWISTEDPKSEVKIGGGRYVDIYDGEKISDSAYTFHAACPPEDCGAENGGMPCIKVTDQDVLCYTVLLADGVHLEISMITGRGNTLAFKRK